MSSPPGGPNFASAVRSRSAQCLHHLGPELCGYREVAEHSMSFTVWGPNFAGTVWSRSARCLHHLGPEHCGYHAVAERPMSPPSASELGQVPCGRGALDVFTTTGPNIAGAMESRNADVSTLWGASIAGAVRSRSARCLHHLCPNLAGGAVWSRSARRLHRLGPEHCGCRAVAERPMSSPPGARTLRVPCGRGALISPPSGVRTLQVPRGRGALDVSTVCVRTGRVP